MRVEKWLKHLKEMADFCRERRMHYAEFSVLAVQNACQMVYDTTAINGNEKLLQIKKDGVVYKFQPGEEIDLAKMGIKRKWEL